MQIKVISRWENNKFVECKACTDLRKLLKRALQELGMNNVQLNECTSEEEFKSYGIVPTPILIINGKIKTAGKVVPLAMLKELIKGEYEKE